MNSSFPGIPKRIIALFIAILLSTFVNAQDVPKPKFIDPGNMDLMTKPGEDFVNYAGGVWLKNNTVPAKETRWGSFNILREFNVKAMQTILTDAMNDKKAPAGSLKRRVGDFYAAGLDSLAAEKLGMDPIRSDLKRAGEVKTIQQVLDEIILRCPQTTESPLFRFSIVQDRKHPEKMVVQFSQGGTTLPDRDYYLKSDPRSKKAQEALNTYMVTLFALTGISETEAKKKAEAIFNLEKKLAKAQMSRVEMRDPQKTYNKLAVADFSKTTPSIDWKSILGKLRITSEDSVLVNVPKFFVAADSLVKGLPMSDWQAYLQSAVCCSPA